ncbi:MAG TPA: DUF6504 family protein [Anaerolineales bacterium]
MEFKPLHFIGEPVEVHFDLAPALEKKPGCPDAFSWQNQTFTIIELLSEWHDYRRRGRMARNMQPQHAAGASLRGSWGVGQDYYRVRTAEGRFFDLYYDRAPKTSDERKGGWFLDKEVRPDQGEGW